MEPLRVFRDRFYACLGRQADTLFELCDAILAAARVPSPPHLSLVSMHRRGWGCLYAALSKGRIDSEALRDLLASYDLGTMGTSVYGLTFRPGHGAMPRPAPDAATSSIHLAIRQASPSSPDGPTSSWLDYASGATPGWRPWMLAGLSQRWIPTAWPRSR